MGPFILMKMGEGGKGNKKVKGHSRTIEQRFQLAPGRVYVHPIPQLLDNIGYLIVCLPPPSSKCSAVVAIFIDCGDANESIAEINHIREVYYPNHPNFELQTLLCTHKHHDHTAGNRQLLKEEPALSDIYGGAIENVPYCNMPVKNGESIVLPSSGENDMNDVASVECIAVPSHTRGSVVYALRNKGKTTENTPIVTYLFTGDALFSGGAGVPFEADLEYPGDRDWKKKNEHSRIKARAGVNSIERCFVEVLVRSSGEEFLKEKPFDHDDDVDFHDFYSTANRRVLLFPGHEYTSDLMKRQFDPSVPNEGGDWTRLPPSIFFDAASRYFVTTHRRTVPKAQRIMTAFTSLESELRINPHMRSLKRRGEHLLHAVRLWHNYGAREKLEQRGWDDVGPLDEDYTITHEDEDEYRQDQTYLDYTDVGKPVFATVYASDLRSVASDLRSGKTDSVDSARRLSSLTSALDAPVVTRRPLPNALPTAQNIYLGLLALALLGSAPSGATVDDSAKMNLRRPAQSSDRIRVSFKRLVMVLRVLGVVSDRSTGDGGENDDDSCDMVRVLNLLWREASEAASGEPAREEEETKTAVEMESGEAGTRVAEFMDEVELGYFKLILYGVTMKQPSWWKRCLPCGSSSSKSDKKITQSWTSEKGIRRSNGELVGHDIHTCQLCRNNVGRLPTFESDDDGCIECTTKDTRAESTSLDNHHIQLTTSSSSKSMLALNIKSDDYDNPYDEPSTPQTPRASANKDGYIISNLLGPTYSDDEKELESPGFIQSQISHTSSNPNEEHGIGGEIEAELLNSPN